MPRLSGFAATCNIERGRLDPVGQKIAAEKIPGRPFLFYPKLCLDHSERLECRLVDRARWFEALSGLIFRQCSAGFWSKNAVDIAPVVALLLEGGLHVSYDLGRIIIRTRGVDRSVPGIHRVGCITPCRVPVRVIPIVPTTVDKDDVVVMRLPPPLVIPKR